MNLNEFLNKNVVIDDMDLKNTVNSKQFKLARRIMELENKFKLSQHETANMLNIKFEKLLDYESANTSITVSDYNKLIQRLENINGMYQFINDENNISNNYIKDSDDYTRNIDLGGLNVLFNGHYRLNGERA